MGVSSRLARTPGQPAAADTGTRPASACALAAGIALALALAPASASDPGDSQRPTAAAGQPSASAGSRQAAPAAAPERGGAAGAEQAASAQSPSSEAPSAAAGTVGTARDGSETASPPANAPVDSASGTAAPAGTPGADSSPTSGNTPLADLPASPAGSPEAIAAPPAAAAPPSPAPPQAQEAARKPSLLPLVQPLWSELSESQRKVLAPLEPQWNTLTRDEKRPWLKLAARIPGMDADARARAEKRIREWASLTPEQRRLARNNYRLARQLPKDERVATWQQYRQMTSEQREVLREAGWTSNTAARHAGAPIGLAKEASQPLWRRIFKWIWKPAEDPPAKSPEPVAGATR